MFYLKIKNILRLRPNLRTLVSFNTVALFSTTASPSNKTTPQNPLIADHLIAAFGFSRDKAISTSTIFPPSCSLASLTSVPDFLKQNGFSDTHIKILISKRPKLLLSTIEKTLKPKFKLFQDIGFSASSLVNFFIGNPSIFNRHIENFLIPTTDILRVVLHSNENIVKVLSRNNWLLSCCNTRIGSNIDLLRQFGVPDKQISILLLNSPRIITKKTDVLKAHVQQVEKLGIMRDSKAFVYAFCIIGSTGEATLKGKFKLYRSYGWSEADIMSAFSKNPQFLKYSEQKVRETMDFLRVEHGYLPKDIALMTHLFGYCLEKRLKPRSEVLKVLYSKGLLKKKPNLVTNFVISDKKFMEKYIAKFADRVPDVRGAYMSSGVQC